MKKNYRLISMTLIGILLLSLAIPTLGFADSPYKSEGEGKQGPPAFVYEKEMKNFTFIEGERIRVNSLNIHFDVPPVIKEGRTLIPVRAITEAMGATVEWDAEDMIVTITSADGETIIMFYLAPEDEGKITVNGEDVTIDVRPGIINSRTFVPLRFIAETLGLKVSHDSHSGNIDLKDGPRLMPKAVSFEAEADIEAVDVKLVLNDYEFTGIEGLDEGVEADDEYTYDEGDAIVTLDADYLESLTEEKTVLTFTFEDEDSTVVERSFKIVLEYLEDELEDEDSEPALNPEKVVFGAEENIVDTDVTMTLNGHTFEGIEGLVEGDEYSVVDNVVTLDDDYMAALEDEETKLNFLFEKDSEVVKEEFEIKLTYLEEAEEPKIAPHKAKFDSPAEATDVDVTLTLNGYSFAGIEGLDAGDDYTITDNIVTIKEAYLEALTEEETTLIFQFEKGSEEAEEEFEVEFDEL